VSGAVRYVMPRSAIVAIDLNEVRRKIRQQSTSKNEGRADYVRTLVGGTKVSFMYEITVFENLSGYFRYCASLSEGLLLS